MTSGSSRCEQLLLHLLTHFLLGVHLCYSLATTKPPICRPDQASTLLQLKRSFSTNGSQCTLASWRPGTDWCRWEGIRCGDADGRVTALDLGGCGLESGGGLHPALFDLTSLRRLDLSGNDFNESRLPSAGFERLAELVYLNLSATGFVGEIPRGIRQLGKLVSLDLSDWIYLLELDDDYFVPLGDGRWPLVESDVGSLVANLSNLKELRLDSVDLSGNGAAWCDGFANSTPQLQVLRLPNTGLHAPICGSLSSIRSLVEITLSYNSLHGQVPETFADLPNLSGLRLSYNQLEGWFPTRIFRNNNLTVVDIRYNFDISGTLPGDFSSDSALIKLLCANTNFSGPVPSSINNLTSLKYLGIASTGFHQQLPSSIGDLKSLRSLEVSGAGIVGKFPSWVTNLTSLLFLQFSNCGLSGEVPSSIGNLNNLTSLQLYACNFSGQIPPHIFNLTQLQVIKFRSTSFIGTIELSSFFKLPNLFRLNLSNNKLTVVEGEYNSSWESIENFDTLGLASCAISKLPDTLRHMHSLEVLDLSNNHLHGVVPQWAWENWADSLILLNLSHNQFTSTGYDFVRPANINLLDISFNLLEGPIPIPGPNNELFDCSNNHFSSMPFNFGSHLSIASFLMASRNNLSGEIPPSICEGTTLQLLDLSYNNFSGSIPSCLVGNMSQLNVLNLKGNRLNGRLPDSLKQECALDAIDFSDNQIEGQLPRSLVACKDLEVFDIGNNQMSDNFPCWMSVLPKLQVLVLKSNKFFGMLGPSDPGDKNSCEFAKLRIFDLASNNFSGLLVPEWFKSMKSMMTQYVNETLVMGNEYKLLDHPYQFTASITYKGLDMIFSKILRTIVVIDISNNAFHGAIPVSIGDLVLLSGVNMSRNSLTGMIPSQLGALHQLESLDVSSNDLSGEIPQELASLDFLSTLNLSNNKLEGRIPESPQFLTFTNLSFLGNIGLCGLQVSKACNNITPNVDPPQSDETKSKDIVLLFLFSGLGFGVGFAVAVVLAFGIRPMGICHGNIFMCQKTIFILV
jgi:Leucine-rich repeat (LRR) protein